MSNIADQKIDIRKSNPDLYAHLILRAILHIAFGIAILLSSDRNTGRTPYEVIVHIVSFPMWAVISVAIGIGILLSMHLFKYKWVRFFLGMSVAMMTMWALGFLAAFLGGSKISLTVLVVYGYVAVRGIFIMKDTPINPSIAKVI